MKRNLSKIVFSIGAILLFVLIALVYNSPVITGSKALSQGDITNYKGGAQEMLEFQKKTNEKTYWSDAMFGGMPTYQMGASYESNWIKSVDETLRFLPRPADYVFLLFFGFFILGWVLFNDWKYALLGALLFAMGTYFFIVIEAGHNAKVHAVAYFAPLTAGILLLYKGKYILGFLTTTLFMALELVASHPQMTYYLGLALLIYVVAQLIESIKTQKLKTFIIASILAVSAVILAIGMNSANLLSTYEYSKLSTRGQNDITLLKNENPNGLDKDYITNWSYGQLETLNLFIPNFMGGGSSEPIEYKENLKKSIQTNAQSQEEFAYYMNIIDYIPTYWGAQPFTGGPAYQGAIVVFLFILGLFFVKGKYKWWLAIATLLSILLAWGKNFMGLTNLFIDYVPLYDKFRAVSSILVIAEFTMPLLAVFGVYKFLTDEKLTQSYKTKILKFVGGGVVVLLILFYLLGETLFGFNSQFDRNLPDFMRKAIVKDREAMFQSDILRTLVFVVLSLLVMGAYLFKKIKSELIIVAVLGLLTVIDLWGVDKRYLNNNNYIAKQWVDYPFPTEMSDKLMAEAQENSVVAGIASKVNYNKALKELKEKDPSIYRVFNSVGDAFNEAGTSYFHHSVGGYHGAKLQSIQNIIDIYFSQDSIMQQQLGVAGQQQKILNLLNTKYIAVGDMQNPQMIENPYALGNAWFVNEVKNIGSANDAIKQIAQIDERTTAIVEAKETIKSNVDSLAQIQLKKYKPNHLVYESQSNQDGFIVFSEMYYNKGWEATLDGGKAKIYKTNYFLRGMVIPAGKHQIEFTFEPSVVSKGNTITFGANILFLLAILGALFWWWKGDEIMHRDNLENQE